MATVVLNKALELLDFILNWISVVFVPLGFNIDLWVMVTWPRIRRVQVVL